MRFGIEIAVATLPIRALLALAIAVRQAAPGPEKLPTRRSDPCATVQAYRILGGISCHFFRRCLAAK